MGHIFLSLTHVTKTEVGLQGEGKGKNMEAREGQKDLFSSLPPTLFLS